MTYYYGKRNPLSADLISTNYKMDKSRIHACYTCANAFPVIRGDI